MKKENIFSERRFKIKNSNHFFRVTFYHLFIACIFSIGLMSCDSSTEPEKQNDLLEVRFTNDSESTFTISNIQLQAMGNAGESTEPAGEWGGNILTGGKRLAPGEYETFNLDIPNLHWSRYRLGVINSEGNEIMLHEQADYEPWLDDPSITHWGGDDRTVEVRVVQEQSTGLIIITGWSDNTGIED
jgi:hypothetical protein